MVYIPGSNNGVSGAGQYRSLYPSSLGGFSGLRGMPLPNAFAHPAPTMAKPYNASFGKKRRSHKRKSRKTRKTRRKSRKTCKTRKTRRKSRKTRK
jgi:hypothetical protein